MNTNTLLIGTAAAIALTGAANASTSNGWYVGLEAGANWIQDADVVLDDVQPNKFSFDTGWAAFGTVGHAWNNFRVELEIGYRDNKFDKFDGGESGLLPLDGKFNEFSQMLNVVYDWSAFGKWGLFVGAGAGGDFISYEQDSTHNPTLLHDDAWVFAWQALAGVNYELTPNTDLFVGYRYFNANEPEFSVPSHSDSYDTVHKHTATIGLRYAFGTAPAPEPYVAPPPPPPEPAAATPAEFIVFFGHNKTNLVPEAMRVIMEAAAAAKQSGSASISVVGHADRSGSDVYNNALSQRRSNVVKDALTAQGIPAGAISVSAKGESDPLVPTADGVREPQNRRVNINL
ncbi:MAG: OmpA family protein [Micropepsaceae bacterium]